MGRCTLEEVRDGSGDPRGGPRRVGGPSVRFGKVRWTLGEVRDESLDIGEVRDRWVDPRGGPRRVGGPSGRLGTVHWTVGEVRDG